MSDAAVAAALAVVKQAAAKVPAASPAEADVPAPTESPSLQLPAEVLDDEDVRLTAQKLAEAEKEVLANPDDKAAKARRLRAMYEARVALERASKRAY